MSPPRAASRPHGATVRLFLAVEVPADHAEELFRALPDGLPGLRRSRPDAMHVTLAFLGATPEVRLGEVVSAASTAAAATCAFSFTIDRLGRFPPEGAPRTIWAGPSTAREPLGRLALRVRAELRGRGIWFDGKPFQPHVTIARVVDRQAAPEARAIAAAVAARRLRMAPVPVREVAVIESILSPRGARYVRRWSAPLATGRGRRT